MARHVGAIHHPMIASMIPFSICWISLCGITMHRSPIPPLIPVYAAKQAHEFTDIILGGDGPDQILCGSGHLVFAEKTSSV